MVELRNDLFPKMIGFFEPKERTIRRWADEAFEAFKSLFSSNDDFIKYISGMNATAREIKGLIDLLIREGLRNED